MKTITRSICPACSRLVLSHLAFIANLYNDPLTAMSVLLAAAKAGNPVLIMGDGCVNQDFLIEQYELSLQRDRMNTPATIRLLEFALEDMPTRVISFYDEDGLHYRDLRLTDFSEHPDFRSFLKPGANLIRSLEFAFLNEGDVSRDEDPEETEILMLYGSESAKAMARSAKN